MFLKPSPLLCRGGTQLCLLLRAAAGPPPVSQSCSKRPRLQPLLAAQGQSGDIPVPPCPYAHRRRATVTAGAAALPVLGRLQLGHLPARDLQRFLSSAQPLLRCLNALGTALWLSRCCSPGVLASPMLPPALYAPQPGSRARPGPPGPPRGAALLELAALSAAPPRSCLQERRKHELMVPGFPPVYTALPRAALE